MEIRECAAFRLTRDADFEVSDEADDLLEAVQLELHRRRFGDIVRIEVADSVSPDLLERLKRGMRVDDEQVYLVPGLLDLADAMQLAALDRPELKDEPWVPVDAAPVRQRCRASIFSEIAKADILVHHPYDSFASSFEAFVARRGERPGRDRR